MSGPGIPAEHPAGAGVTWAPRVSVATLKRRAQIFAAIRSFFAERDVLEFHPPALARYTVTDPHVEAIPVPGYGYLQTSPEAAMKRALAAGAPDLYALGPAFRADEQGRLHAPEFTLLEWYRREFDDAALRLEVAELVDQVLGPAEYTTISYDDLLAQAVVAEPLPEDPVVAEDLKLIAGLEALGPRRVFVVDFPAASAAMARLQPERPHLAARFELIINGIEIANGYDEGTDAAQLRQRFAEDQVQRRAAGAAVPAADPYLLAALEAGLPQCAGVALGVDRLIMLALGASGLDAVQPLTLDPPVVSEAERW